MKWDRYRKLLLLIGFSFVVFIFFWVLRAGVELTPSATTDSSGRTMGFNDRFSREHYVILLKNFRVREMFRFEYLYEWFLVGMHAVGAYLLLSRKNRGRRSTRWFFFAQPVLFPFGWVGFLFLPVLALDFVRLEIDREGFVDIPFIWFTAQPVWIAVALLVAIAIPRREFSPVRPGPQLTDAAD